MAWWQSQKDPGVLHRTARKRARRFSTDDLVNMLDPQLDGAAAAFAQWRIGKDPKALELAGEFLLAGREVLLEIRQRQVGQG